MELVVHPMQLVIRIGLPELIEVLLPLLVILIV